MLVNYFHFEPSVAAFTTVMELESRLVGCLRSADGLWPPNGSLNSYLPEPRLLSVIRKDLLLRLERMSSSVSPTWLVMPPKMRIFS